MFNSDSHREAFGNSASDTSIGLPPFKSKLEGQELRDSELLFRSMIENSGDVIARKNMEGIITYISPSVERVMGYTQEEQIGHYPSEFLWEEDLEKTAKEFAVAIQNPGLTVSFVFRVKHKNGTPLWMEGSAVNLLHVAGVESVIVNMRDITARKLAEEALHQSEVRFRSLIENNADMMTLASADGRLLYASPSLTHVLGFSTEELLTLPASQLIYPDDVPRLMENMLRIIEKPGESFYSSHRLMHKDGSYRWCEGAPGHE
ncbi:MAG: PAS domain S-box protein [Saprospiraceae bacterium]|nr:PAS domain S-box protein [Saprospiraceae bacterium]